MGLPRHILLYSTKIMPNAMGKALALLNWNVGQVQKKIPALGAPGCVFMERKLSMHNHRQFSCFLV